MGKNILFLNRYKSKLKDNNIFIIKNIFNIIFNKELRSETFLRRKVIKQNIILFKAKEKWVSYSYTYVKKWFNKVIETILNILNNFKKYLFIVILLYSLIYIIFLNINYYFKIVEPNYEWLFYFLVIFFVYLVLYFTKNIYLIILNFVFLFFIIIFWLFNF